MFGLVGTGYAQQNFFNIPSGDITPKNQVFYQHQINLYREGLESKGHFVYGLGRGWDAGINVVGKGAYFRPQWRLMHNDQIRNGPVFPVVMGTVQKQFVLHERLALNLGTQAGTNLTAVNSRREFNHFTYGLANISFGPGRKILAGGYATNRAYVGEGNHQGVLLGYEWKLTEKWYLMGDWISGRNSQSVGVIGAMFWPFKHVQFCAGLLVPNPRTDKQGGLVLEINILGWDARH